MAKNQYNKAKENSMKRGISDYLPDRKVEVKLVQAKVDRSLFDAFREIQKKKKVKFVDFVEASMAKFIDENR